MVIHVNWTTDGAANMVSARAPGHHVEVHMETNHTTNCVDHQIHLVVEESLKRLPTLENAIKKARKMVEYLKAGLPVRIA